jgi:hypothetical protein
MFLYHLNLLLNIKHANVTTLKKCKQIMSNSLQDGLLCFTSYTCRISLKIFNYKFYFKISIVKICCFPKKLILQKKIQLEIKYDFLEKNHSNFQ